MINIKRILVVNRYNENFRDALDAGITIARKFGAELSLLHVTSDPADLEAVNAPDLLYVDTIEDFRNRKQEEAEMIEKMICTSAEANVPIKNILSFGTETDDIVTAVKQNDIDLLVLIAHEEGRIEHVLFGGVNEGIIRQMPCSIMLVKKEPGAVVWDTEDNY